MLHREIVVVYSKNHTKHINALCGQNVEILNAKYGGTYSDQAGYKGIMTRHLTRTPHFLLST
jgi:hypothetical protein